MHTEADDDDASDRRVSLAQKAHKQIPQLGREIVAKIRDLVTEHTRPCSEPCEGRGWKSAKKSGCSNQLTSPMNAAWTAGWWKRAESARKIRQCS